MASIQCLPQLSSYQIRVKLPTLKWLTIVTLFFNSQDYKSYLALEQFLSDVGGAAGLVLGMSLTTILGIFDCFILSVASMLHVTLRRSAKYIIARGQHHKHHKTVSAYTIACR